MRSVKSVLVPSDVLWMEYRSLNSASTAVFTAITVSAPAVSRFIHRRTANGGMPVTEAVMVTSCPMVAVELLRLTDKAVSERK